MVPLGRYLHAAQRSKETRFPLHKQTGTERNSISGSNTYKPSEHTTLLTMNFICQIQKLINRELSVFFLIIAKKIKLEQHMSVRMIGISLSEVLRFDYIKCLPLEGNITWTAERKAIAANIF